jgi:hypothetical protein
MKQHIDDLISRTYSCSSRISKKCPNLNIRVCPETEGVTITIGSKIAIVIVMTSLFLQQNNNKETAKFAINAFHCNDPIRYWCCFFDNENSWWEDDIIESVERGADDAIYNAFFYLCEEECLEVLKKTHA